MTPPVQFALFFSIALSIFRLPLSAGFEAQNHARLLSALPLLLALLLAVAHRKKLTFQSKKILNTWFVFSIVSLLSLFSIHLNAWPEGTSTIRNTIVPTMVVTLFPLSLLLFDFETKTAVRALRSISYLFVMASFTVMLFVEKTTLTPRDLLSILVPDVWKHPEYHTVGLLANIPNSALLVSALSAFLLFELKQKDSFTSKALKSIAVICGFIFLARANSLLHSATLMLLVGIKTTNSLRTLLDNRPLYQALSWLALCCAVTVAIYNIPEYLLVPMKEKFNFYLTSLDLSKAFNITASGSVGSFLINFSFPTRNGFEINEVHSLVAFSNYGLLPTLTWYMWFVLATTIVLKKRIWREHPSIPAALTVFLASAIHYSGAEAWGPNYVFLTLVTVGIRFLEQPEISEQTN